jgi:4-amino-4-deoxy-L-arabinose transferase-like glycosyltransferase
MSKIWKHTWLSPQVMLVIIAWLFLYWLHWNNNGLWYGDAPRHAANGIFWKDFLLSFSLEPKSYALSYFARYPVIAPTLYPPLFYILEAVSFGLFGPSPYIAKSLVLGFTLIATLYTTAWCRRWISVDAGWAGVLFVFLPGVVYWSHAIMLNIPALALSIGSLYHIRRWMESSGVSPSWKHLYIGAILGVSAILTYLLSIVLVFIILTWFMIKRPWQLLWNQRTLVVILLSILALLPWFLVVLKFEKMRVGWAIQDNDVVFNIQNWPWLYYIQQLPKLFNIHILLTAAFGIIGGLSTRRWRQETCLLSIMIIVCYVFFTYVPAREARYILLLSLPIVCLCIIALLCVTTWISSLLKLRNQLKQIVTMTAILMFIAVQAWLISRMLVPSVEGIDKIVKYIENIAPEEPVFYCGVEHANFTFNILAGDPGYRRRVVLSRKLLYAESSWDKIHEFISSPGEAIEILKNRGGCRWLVIARRVDTPASKASKYLRQAVKGPEFEPVKSFPIKHLTQEGWEESMVDIYKFLIPIEKSDVIDMPLFSLGENVRIQIKPIQR